MCKNNNCNGCCEPKECGCKVRLETTCLTVNINLPNIGTIKGENLNTVLKKLDTKIGEIISNLQ